MRTIKLPDKCPLCGAELSGGSDKMSLSYQGHFRDRYSTPIHFYNCGAKMWLSEIHKPSGQCKILFNPCEEEE